MPPKKKQKFTHKKGGKTKKPPPPGAITAIFGNLAAGEIKEEEYHNQIIADEIKNETEDAFLPPDEVDINEPGIPPVEPPPPPPPLTFEQYNIPPEEKAELELKCLIPYRRWRSSYNAHDREKILKLWKDKRNMELLSELVIVHSFLDDMRNKIEPNVGGWFLDNIRETYHIPKKKDLPGTNLWEFHILYFKYPTTDNESKLLVPIGGRFLRLVLETFQANDWNNLLDKFGTLLLRRHPTLPFPPIAVLWDAFFMKLCKAFNNIHHAQNLDDGPPDEGPEISVEEPGIEGGDDTGEEPPLPPPPEEPTGTCPPPDPNTTPADLVTAQQEQLACFQGATQPGQPAAGAPEEDDETETEPETPASNATPSTGTGSPWPRTPDQKVQPNQQPPPPQQSQPPIQALQPILGAPHPVDDPFAAPPANIQTDDKKIDFKSKLSLTKNFDKVREIFSDPLVLFEHIISTPELKENDFLLLILPSPFTEFIYDLIKINDNKMFIFEIEAIIIQNYPNGMDNKLFEASEVNMLLSNDLFTKIAQDIPIMYEVKGTFNLHSFARFSTVFNDLFKMNQLLTYVMQFDEMKQLINTYPNSPFITQILELTHMFSTNFPQTFIKLFIDALLKKKVEMGL